MPYIRIFITLFLAFSAIFIGFLYAAYALKTTNYIAFQLLASANILLIIAFFSGCLSALIIGLFSYFWLSPLIALTKDMSAITAHPEELHAPHSSKNMPAPILHAQNSLTNLHKKVRQSIRQRQRLADAGEAVAKINHDLRNMLASVMLVTDQLESSADPKVAQVAPVVIRATEQATNLCQNMLDYLSDLPVARPELIEMDALMEELASTANIYLEYSGPDKLYTDRLMLYRILLNLFRNAADAGADNLLIDVWQAGHLAVIDIIDNGPGIEPRMQNQIFTAFTSGQVSHIGLGLSICLDLALALEGRLTLARSSPDGSAFRLQLPAGVLDRD